MGVATALPHPGTLPAPLSMGLLRKQHNHDCSFLASPSPYFSHSPLSPGEIFPNASSDAIPSALVGMVSPDCTSSLLRVMGPACTQCPLQTISPVLMLLLALQ